MITAFLSLATVVASALPEEPPRLAVIISVDQLFPEQLDRLEPWLEGGLGRIWREGQVHRAAMLPYSASETGPGHATVSTGCLPARHGIVGNAFHDRATSRTIYCVGDDSARLVGQLGVGEGSGPSPANLLVPTIGDRLREAVPGARVLSIAGKDRSAVGMGGWAAEPALWWDRRAGDGFITSSAYVEELPEWVRRWNADWLSLTRGWTWSPDFPGDPAKVGTDRDDRPGEVSFKGQGTRMPYVMAADAPAPELASAVYGSPLVDLFTIDLASRGVRELGLGTDDATDLLILGLSGCDTVGHSFGPYSYEVTDLILKVDASLGALFSGLDEVVGEGKWSVALTSDHGVLELPEYLQARGVGARRVLRGDISEAYRNAREAVRAEFPDLDVSASFDGRWLTFDEGPVVEAGIEPAEFRAIFARGLESADWIQAAHTLEDLCGTQEADPWLGLYRRAFHPDRAPDVVVQPSPWTLINSSRGTSHGSVYPYDRRIPLAFYGAGFEEGIDYLEASSADIAPTLLELIGVPFDADAMDGLSRL